MRIDCPHIVLADDDKDDCMLFEDALLQLNKDSKLTISSDGQELIEMLKENVPPPPDVIFLDINMPRKNGFECLDAIRSTQEWQDIPVVVFSTTSQPDAIRKMYDGGADYFILKPRQFADLKTLISKILSFNFKKMVSPTRWENFIVSCR